MPPTSRLEVDLTAISANVRVMRGMLESRIAGAAAGGRAVPATTPGICAVLKADAYSLGAARIAKRLSIAGVEMLAVYTPEQARALIDAAITAPILMLMPVHEMERGDPLYRAASRGQLHFTVHDRSTLDALATMVEKLGLHLSAHLELDTGMSRGGANLDEAGQLFERMVRMPRIRIAGIFNHFASADTDDAMTRRQADDFSRWLEERKDRIPPDCVIHEANTFGAFRSGVYHRSMVRVGLALLGYASEDFRDRDGFEFAPEAERLTPALRWVSQLVHVKTIEAGTSVGYQATWRAARRTRLGLVPVGYADGYPLSLSNAARVGVVLSSGIKAFAPLVGRVSMDQFTVDLTDVPEEQVGVGSVVEVVGNDRTAPNHLPELARRGGTIVHELLCRLSARLPRQYIAVEQPAATPVTGAVAV